MLTDEPKDRWKAKEFEKRVSAELRSRIYEDFASTVDCLDDLVAAGDDVTSLSAAEFDKLFESRRAEQVCKPGL